MKKVLMTSAVTLALLGGTALAQMQPAPTDRDQNRHMQTAPEQRPDQSETKTQGEAQQQNDIRRVSTPTNDMRQDRRQNAREERRGQGEAARIAPTKVLSGSERETVRKTVIESSSAPRVDKLNISVRIGAPIPRSIRAVTVPHEIVALYPQWNGFLYFVSGDEVVVVDPDSYAVVGVLEA